MKPDELEDLTVCPNCHIPMEPMSVNNGFDPPDPPKWEVVGFECPQCGYKLKQ